jgi:hypothetical protein
LSGIRFAATLELGRSERTIMRPPAARAAMDRISHGVDFDTTRSKQHSTGHMGKYVTLVE